MARDGGSGRVAGRPPADVVALAALFAVSGTLHGLRPELFERIVPRGLPGRRGLVYASGAAELLCAVGLMVPRTRRRCGLVSAALLVAIFPANVQMAVDVLRSRRSSSAMKVAAVARLPVQWPLVRAGWRTYRSAGN